MTSIETSLPQRSHETTVVFVNGDRFVIQGETVQVGTLIIDGGGQPGQYELQQREGANGPVVKTYTDPLQTIPIKNGEHFTTRFIGTINPS